MSGRDLFTAVNGNSKNSGRIDVTKAEDDHKATFSLVLAHWSGNLREGHFRHWQVLPNDAKSSIQEAQLPIDANDKEKIKSACRTYGENVAAFPRSWFCVHLNWSTSVNRSRLMRWSLPDRRSPHPATDAPIPKSFRSSPATSPPTEAISLPEVLCAAARTHGRLAHTSASPRERLGDALCRHQALPTQHTPEGSQPI
jgi:hypothetical protein